MADHGVAADAQVDEVRWKEKRVSGRKSGFTAAVHFEDAQHQRVDASLSISKDVADSLRNDQAPMLKVKYLPEDPKQVVLADHKDGSGFMYGAGTVAILIGVGIFLWRRRSAAQLGLGVKA